ncbi:hypothetical protein TREES_T100008803 [Tupaia chinensis]|uniref:Uncharacterized protein n=1 Tax=Tupaia chinensis TaxID=246437 RepID=L9L535_TUPCH|nr:hypothetical protein TREES_T100008803 [Tupaia chinensis]
MQGQMAEGPVGLSSGLWTVLRGGEDSSSSLSFLQLCVCRGAVFPPHSPDGTEREDGVNLCLQSFARGTYTRLSLQLRPTGRGGIRGKPGMTLERLAEATVPFAAALATRSQGLQPALGPLNRLSDQVPGRVLPPDTLPQADILSTPGAVENREAAQHLRFHPGPDPEARLA